MTNEICFFAFIDRWIALVGGIVCSSSGLNLSVDNDLYFGIDRYYSSGVFISMGNLKPVTDKEAAPSKRYAHWTLGQEIYTPSNRYTIDTNKFDYPYGGWLFWNGLLKITKIPFRHGEYP